MGGSFSPTEGLEWAHCRQRNVGKLHAGSVGFLKSCTQNQTEHKVPLAVVFGVGTETFCERSHSRVVDRKETNRFVDDTALRAGICRNSGNGMFRRGSGYSNDRDKARCSSFGVGQAWPRQSWSENRQAYPSNRFVIEKPNTLPPCVASTISDKGAASATSPFDFSAGCLSA